MDGYLDAISPEQGIHVTLGGREQWVARARFGVHMHLGQLDERIDKALSDSDFVLATAQIRQYLDEVGVVTGNATGVELLSAFLALRQVNLFQWLVPMLASSGGDEEKPAPYDYGGRTSAWWVHRLASRYGWSRSEIFDLWPEEAACYLQEITVSEYDEADARRALSQMTYNYNKATGKVTWHPLPRPAWMTGKGERKKRRVRRDVLPMGDVVDLSKLGGVGEKAIS